MEIGQIAGNLLEPRLRLGVTGLARAGKTVFITSLVANLLERGRMLQLQAERGKRIEAAFLQPQPDDTIPRFDYETHLADLTGPAPCWPDSTRAISQLRLSFRLRPQGMIGALAGPRRMHLDIVDYPGEWLLDLGLMERSFAQWSQIMLERMRRWPGHEEFAALAHGAEPAKPFDETLAQRFSGAWTALLQRARKAGFSDCAPGRFLMPGDLEGSPVLGFAPLPDGTGGLHGEFARRFEAYKAKVARPFFRDHFAKIDRQVVLVDVLGALDSGPAALRDLQESLSDVLSAFRPGKAGFLGRLLGQKRVDRLLFAATKADHLHHSQHDRLSALLEALLNAPRAAARFKGAEVETMALAALRATTETTLSHQGQDLPCVRGTLIRGDAPVACYPGSLPADPSALLAEARESGQIWQGASFEFSQFAPTALTCRAGEGPPHIRLDRAAEFLIGDRL